MDAMRKKLVLLFSVIYFLGSSPLLAQQQEAALEGSVSYISSQNIYVKFDSTEGLQQGDTLYMQRENQTIPVLIIQQLSTISCVAKPINEEVFSVGDRIIGWPKKRKPLVQDVQETGITLLPETNEVKIIQEDVPPAKKGAYEQDIWGRLNVSAYSNFSNNFNNDNQRFRYTFNLQADHIANSAISLETYVAFSNKRYNGIAVPSSFSDLKLYNLAVRFDLSKNTRIWAGRKINSKIANVGAVDGLQAETTFKNFTLGAVVGSRPSYADYGIDFSLFEFGAYFAHLYHGTNGMMENTFSVFEQKNSGKTDRRFMYLQQSNSLAKNLYAFVSFEVDMFRIENNVPMNKLSLTSMYASLRYRFSSKFNATASYDARKNVVYYETFQNLADSILESATRQGYRIRLNYRPLNKFSIGVSASYRNRPGDIRPTKNANAYLRYSQVPFIKASFSITANWLQTSYLDGLIYGAQIDKDFFSGKLNAGLNYHHVNYDFVNSSSPLNQNIGELNLDWQIIKDLSLSVSYEGVFESDNQYNRVYLSLRKRF